MNDGRLTAGLAVALLAATLVWWFDHPPERAAGGRDARPAPTPFPRLLSFDAPTVTAVELARGAQRVGATRAGGDWSDQPLGPALDDFLRNIQELGLIADIDDAPVDLGDYGLDRPSASLRIERRNAPPINLAIGAPNAAGTGVYVRFGPRGRVALAGALLQWEVDKLLRVRPPAATPNTSGAAP